MAEQTEHTKKDKMLKALEKSLGVVTTACKMAGVGRTTFYEWLDKDPDFKKAVDDFKDVAIDTVESKLYDLIKEGNVTATIFYLKTKGKKRGYIERQEIAHEGVLESKVIEWVPSKE
jgi:hypothetical protein